MKQKFLDFFKKFNFFDWFLLAFGLISTLVTSIIVKSSAIVILYSIFGVLYVVLWAKKANFALFFGLIYVSLYMVQCILSNYWGEVIINGVISLVSIIVTIALWLGKRGEKQFEAQQHDFSGKEWTITAAVIAVLSVGLYFFMDYLGTPYIYLALPIGALGLLNNWFVVRKNKWMFVGFLVSNVLQMLVWLMPIIEGQSFGLENLPIVFTMATFFMSNVVGMISWFKKSPAKSDEKQVQKTLEQAAPTDEKTEG